MRKTKAPLIPNRTIAEFVEYLEKLSLEVQELYCIDQIPWVIGYSGGKDSTATLQLIWNAIAALPPEKLIKPIYVISTDTLVENPIVSAWVDNSLKRIKIAAQEQNLPIEAHLLKPQMTHTYWVGLIGKGYPAPRHRFRWCTPRLKIDPSNRFIRNVVRSNREAVVVLGTRKTESSNRAKIMEKREAKRLRERLCPHPHIPNSLLYTPIEEWRTDEVWLYLMQWENPWGHSNKDLFAMYRGATADNECPLVVDTSTPSCGSSRFGCWVCTLVDSDKSLTAMIQNDEEKEWLQPLVDIRLELDIRNDRDKRDFRRIFGTVQLFERNVNGEVSVEPIPGPYVKKWREHWLRRVLEAQTKIRQTAPEEMRDITLIQPEELSEIRRIWLEEKHEFDDSLPRIYKEVTGETFIDTYRGNETSLLGSDEWTTLEDICGEDAMHLELMAKLLDTERQYYTKARRVGLFEDLEKCFETSSRTKEEAIANAHLKRNLKIAAQEGDVETIKQLTWENLKYSNNSETNDEEEE
ncbi:DNA phosphorothioation system sulfurtransferase DndC [Limnoraphis robusta Tam1]|uniref:DNA phosphorothioation system sulfurtransferase DndC n=1 Tax=Limnoraphis robusta TaxID=1118279 RepID=UPI002B20A59D|nr:DNA phosphorothioation system sulfurtransferase DndC [Limnoraphis robusta]MEA5497017.1 DNA phosphorothioation system sulfurtransferase DndC [Limnoraphis robusta BA-68 BA1]MEA5539581.1 DNA phosphorothioation system sulfurtransferase DndC [Limnoraphis robusta Tam1]